MIGKDTYIIAALNTKGKLRLKKMGQKSLTMAIWRDVVGFDETPLAFWPYGCYNDTSFV